MDHRATLHRQDLINQQTRMVLCCKSRAVLKTDRCQCAVNVGTAVMDHLKARELQEAWHTIKGWYTTATDQPPKFCYRTMAKQTLEREELYRKVHPQESLSHTMLNPQT